MYDDVLVPTDGSDAAGAAVDQGIAVADRFDAALHLLYVVDVETEMSASALGTIAEELTEALERTAEEALDAAESQAEEAGVPTERTVLEGLPSDGIIEHADEQGVDLVVVGASGQSGLKAHLLGSTADRVAQGADTSVLIARPSGERKED